MDDEERRFTVRCRECGRIVLAGVERVADAETTELRAHLATCRGDQPGTGELGALLAHFDVRSVR